MLTSSSPERARGKSRLEGRGHRTARSDGRGDICAALPAQQRFWLQVLPAYSGQAHSRPSYTALRSSIENISSQGPRIHSTSSTRSSGHSVRMCHVLSTFSTWKGGKKQRWMSRVQPQKALISPELPLPSATASSSQFFFPPVSKQYPPL